jgi:hypothetical protein
MKPRTAPDPLQCLARFAQRRESCRRDAVHPARPPASLRQRLRHVGERQALRFESFQHALDRRQRDRPSSALLDEAIWHFCAPPRDFILSAKEMATGQGYRSNGDVGITEGMGG